MFIPWNACPVKCAAYLTGAKPIPSGQSIFNQGGLDPDKNCSFMNRKPAVLIFNGGGTLIKI
jgi:hypothetical protein